MRDAEADSSGSPAVAFTVVTVNYGVSHLIPRLLASLPQSSDVIVVDNFHSSVERALTTQLGSPIVTVLESDNLGYAAGFNLACQHIPPDRYVLLANPDAYFTRKDGATRLVAEAERRRLGLASPVILQPGSERVWFAGGSLGKWTGRVTHHAIGSPWTGVAAGGDFISGCLMLVSPAARATLGDMDSTLFLYYEDAEYSLRARDYGLRVGIIDEVTAFHDGGASSKTHPGEGISTAAYFYQSRNRLLTLRRRGGWPGVAAVGLTPIHLAVDLARMFRQHHRLPRSQTRSLLLGYRQGLRPRRARSVTT